MSFVECVPNFSEGRRPEVVAAIEGAIAAIEGVDVLDSSMDHSHNRSVITFVVPVHSAVRAAFAGISKACELIDLNQHTGEHPRIGAADVVPFVPVGNTTMQQCVLLARELGELVATRLNVPVYLYERAATTEARHNLSNIRKGNFEGLRDAIGVDPTRAPDFGPLAVHPTFGAVAIGARPVLVAYNVYLGGGENLPVARQIARDIRESSGGLPAVKAMGLLVDGQAQVSMNLVDISKTPVHVAFDAIAERAAAAGVPVTWSELIGLIPESAILHSGAQHLKLRNFSEQQILDKRVQQVLSNSPTVETFLSDMASASPVPGGGTAAAHSGALAAALVQMVAQLTAGRKKYAAVHEEMVQIASEAEQLRTRLSELGRQDAAAYKQVSDAYKRPRGNDTENGERVAAIDAALIIAATVPAETAEACERVAALAEAVSQRGNSNAVSDAGVGALLATAACEGAAANVRVNIAALSEPATHAAHDLLTRAERAVHNSLAHNNSARAALTNSISTG